MLARKDSHQLEHLFIHTRALPVHSLLSLEQMVSYGQKILISRGKHMPFALGNFYGMA